MVCFNIHLITVGVLGLLLFSCVVVRVDHT